VFERSIVHAAQVLSLFLSDTTPGALRSVKESLGGRAARIVSAARLIDWLRHAAAAAGSGGRRNDQDLETEERGDDLFSNSFHCCADYSSSRQRECHRSAPHKQKRVQSFPGYGGRLWYVQVLVFSPAPAPFKYAFKPFLDFCNCSRSRTEFQISFFFRRLVTLAHTKLERVERLSFGLVQSYALEVINFRVQSFQKLDMVWKNKTFVLGLIVESVTSCWETNPRNYSWVYHVQTCELQVLEVILLLSLSEGGFWRSHQIHGNNTR